MAAIDLSTPERVEMFISCGLNREGAARDAQIADMSEHLVAILTAAGVSREDAVARVAAAKKV